MYCIDKVKFDTALTKYSILEATDSLLKNTHAIVTNKKFVMTWKLSLMVGKNVLSPIVLP